MLISQKSKEIIDSCRFCWMCRHICPIGNATGQERNNARARALSLSMVERGFEMSESIAQNLYECALCGACTKECATGWDPVKFTKETRLEAVINGKAPAFVDTMLQNLETTGNVYGITGIGELEDVIDTLPKTSGTLFYLGSDARTAGRKCAADAILLLKKAGVDFTVLKDEPDSGYAMDFLVGGADETKQAMQKAAQMLTYDTIVVYDPADAKVFLHEYKEWDIPLKANIIPFPAFLNTLIKTGKLSPQKGNTTFTIQDPAHLARDLEETEDLREILTACGDVKEMLLNRKDTMWAGNLLMKEYMPNTIDLVAKNRWENAKSTGADALVCASISEYLALDAVKPDDMKLLTLEQAVLACL